jgi:hypothetical protein
MDNGNSTIVCNPFPIGGDNSTQIGLAAAWNGEEVFITATIRFRSLAQNIGGNMTIRLEDNNMLVLPSVNSDLSFIGNSQVAQAVFSLTNEQLQKLKSSKLRVVSLDMSDGPRRVYEATMNKNILSSHIACFPI